MIHRARHRRTRISSWPGVLALALLLAPVAELFRRSWTRGLGCGALQSPLDVRFVGYVLEWGYLHLLGAAAPDRSLWSPPFFYPVRDVLAYSENLFSGYLVYFPVRWLGLGAASAVFLFDLIQLALTPVVTFLCLRRLRLGLWSSFVGAAVYSWGWIRYYHYGHIQFSAGYPIPLFFTALYFAFHRRQPWALAVAAWTFLYAWYFSLYTAIFLVLGTLALLGAQLVVPGGARELGRVARSYRCSVRARPRQALSCLGLCVAALALVVPSAAIYAHVQRGFGPAPPAEVRTYWGDILSWVRPPPEHAVLGGFHDDFPAEWGGIWEKRAFLGWLGFAGLVLPAGGLLIRRRKIYSLWPRSLVVASGAGAALILVFSSYGGRWPETPFWALHEHLPGVGGLRAPTRIAFVVSWFTVVCLAVHLERLASRRSVARMAAAGGLGLALLVENLAPLPPVTDRCADEVVWKQTERQLCPRIPRDEIGTLLFLPTGVYSIRRLTQNTLAMQLSLACDLNVVNGYSGRRPRLIEPLLETGPRDFPCHEVRKILDQAHLSSGKGVLVYVDRQPPLGLSEYPVEAIAACLAPCLGPEPTWYVEQPGRPSELFVTDPRASCSGAMAPRPTAHPPASPQSQ